MNQNTDQPLQDMSLDELLTKFAERVCFEQQQKGPQNAASRMAIHYPGLFIERLPKVMLASLPPQTSDSRPEADKMAALKKYCIARLQTPLAHAPKFKAASPFKDGTVSVLPVPYQLRIAEEGEAQFAEPLDRTSLALGKLNTFLPDMNPRKVMDRVNYYSVFYDTNNISRESILKSLMLPVVNRELEQCFGTQVMQQGRSKQ